MSESETAENRRTNPVLLQQVKAGIWIKFPDADEKLNLLIDAALADLGIVGVNGEKAVTTDPLIIRAVSTYCEMNLGHAEDYERLKASYDEQKAQLRMASGYTVWPWETSA